MDKDSFEKGTIVAGALGECVHVAGVINFLRLAEKVGWRTVFLGPANSIEDVLSVARRENAELVGVSYRLTPETGERLLGEFAEAAADLHGSGMRFAFGGTPPVSARVEALDFFERLFDGSQSIDEVLSYLQGGGEDDQDKPDFPQSLIDRIRWKAPYPVLRHHFGLPTIETTEEGIRRITESHKLDVISLGVDQDAQENFFHPDRQNPRARGAGGVPVRSAEDYKRLYDASRHGNYPLLRTYSGTDDFIELAEMYVESIHLAWCAIPLFWFNKMDGRGPWDLKGSIEQHQNVISWYGKRNIPVELNESHHWGMRDAPDVIFVVSAYLAAYNARTFGAEDYIAQMMFNSPYGTSDAMDLAKMIACLKIIAPLAGPDFRIWRQTRTGLLSYPLDLDEARAHIAASVYLQMALDPHIVHVVGHTEAHHAASAEDVIEACKIAQRAITNAVRGAPDMTKDPAILERVDELVKEAKITLSAIRSLASSEIQDPLTDPETLSRAVTVGILDAPQLKNNPYALGTILTGFDARGACVTVDAGTRLPIPEEERLARLGI